MLNTSYFLLYIASFISLILLIRAFYQGKTNAYFFVIPIFMVFYILPDLIDFIIDYKFTGSRYSYNLVEALTDTKTTIIYNLYITFVLVFFTYNLNKSTKNSFNPLKYSSLFLVDYYKKYKYIYWLVLFLPSIIVISTGNIEFYSTYLTRDRSLSPAIHQIITSLIVIGHLFASIIIARYILWMKTNKSYEYIIPIMLVLVLVGLNNYIHGKRSVVVTFMVIQLIILFVTKVIKRKTLILTIMFFALFFIGFLNIYGKNISDTFVETLKTTRIDFSRDFTLKFVIYNDLLKGDSILPYKGASYLFLLTFFIPRALYPEKPYPYAVYLTNSIFGRFGEDYLYGWGFTSSFATESISNLGWLGLLFFPLFYYFIISRMQHYKSIALHLLTYLIMILLLLIHPIAIMPLLILFIIMALKGNKKFVFKRPL